ncbi:MAG TPA: NAD(P)-binding domain-containing protein, partial [Chloroflexota bacterium]
YGGWFQEVHGLQPDARLARTLSQASDGSSFTAELSDGERVQASHVLVALGFGSFPYVPPELARLVPARRMIHTLDLVDFDALADQDVLIVGGRQSAYEWAALLAEHGARTVHLAHRHAAPRFAPADWTWVEPMLQASATSPGWFRRQTLAEQEATRLRFWAEGRLKLEPWLAPRIARPAVHVWEGASVAAADEQDNGRLRVSLSTDTQINVDRLVLATGYRVDVRRLSLLDGDAARDRQALPAESSAADRSLLARLRSTSGFPSLDEDFQSSVRGLFFSGLPATNDFGPFFGFVAGCRAAPLRILARILRDDPGRRDHPALRHIGRSAA